MTSVRRELHAAFATVAVTGTNGKSTTTSMIDSIVRAAGEPSARVTTLGSWLGEELLASGTTLEAFVAAIESGAKAGIRTLSLEITSRALAEGFAHYWPARVGVFTNLSRDHLDYHGAPERYLAAKAQLFMTLPKDGTAVLNACDPASALLDEVTPVGVRRLAFAARAGAVAPECGSLPLALAARRVDLRRTGTRVELEPGALADALGGELELRVIGTVNADNALAAALAAHSLGYSAAAIRGGLASFPGIVGRFQAVWRDPLVIVDYAHTPDALERTLSAARSLIESPEGRLVCVFGCGGETDVGKRPAMGRAAASLADVVWLTSDNPRHEPPEQIIEQVLAGALADFWEGADPAARRSSDRDVRLETEPDRRAAIDAAIAIARPGHGDIVVIAGKGHETSQWIGDEELPFDDAEVARAACRERFESEDG